MRDATLAGVEAVEAKLDRDAINAVVVLTDGQDTISTATGSDVVRRARGAGPARVGPDPGLHDRLRARRQQGGAGEVRAGVGREDLQGRHG